MIRPKANSNPGRVIRVGPGPGGRLFLRPPSLTASNFEVLQSTDPLFTVFKDLNLLKNCIKNEEASYNFRLGFALSNRPHLHRAYLVTICRLLLLTVFLLSIDETAAADTPTQEQHWGEILERTVSKQNLMLVNVGTNGTILNHQNQQTFPRQGLF